MESVIFILFPIFSHSKHFPNQKQSSLIIQKNLGFYITIKTSENMEKLINFKDL